MLKAKFPIFPAVAVSSILLSLSFVIFPLTPHHFNRFLSAHNLIEFLTAVLIGLLALMAMYAFWCDKTLRLGLVLVLLVGAALAHTFHIFSYPGMPDFITPNSMNKGYWFYVLSKIFLGAAFLVYAAGRFLGIKGIPHTYGVMILCFLLEAAVLLFVLLKPKNLPHVFSGFKVEMDLYRIVLEAVALVLMLAAAYFLVADVSLKEGQNKAELFLQGSIIYALSYAFSFLIKLPAEIYFLIIHVLTTAALIFHFMGILWVSNLQNYFIGNTRSKQFLKHVDNLSSLGYIAAGTVHEIRNSLTSVSGFLQIIKKKIEMGQDLKESDLKMYASLMLSEVDRTNALLNELLFISKPHSQTGLKTCNLGSVVLDVLPIIKNHSLLREVELKVSISKAPMPVHINPQQIKQVILNLTSNAFEAMDSCTKRILSIKCSPLPCGNKIILEISDTGRGIPYHLQERIFEPFFSTKDEKKGTGLGLYVVKTIVDELGGKIWVKSEPGVGTTFFIEFSIVVRPKLKKVENVGGQADVIKAS
ncbi:MAG: GHKL domain-containing protein [Clostridia bacterium]|nr:GHKL domain-containing protein [Clostridia bacterium]